ncbi:S24 family peptidase [Clostridium baratii]|uniref:S24 family peptidase n=1 Tax=Clostridium baratii TaxID=1561 RepID=UPI0030D42C02
MNSIFIDKNLFAINMKRLRKNLNITQSSAAKELNIPRTSIINYEQGKYLPEITTLLNICSLYKCSLGELLNIDNASFMNIPQFIDRIDSNDTIMINKFKEQLNLLTELNLKNIKLNNEIKADKNKLVVSLKKLNASQNRYNKSIKELNDTKKHYDRLVTELNEQKKNYAKLINNLTSIQDTYLKASSDIDDTRTYFLNSFSKILENANTLITKLEIDSDINNIETNINPINIDEEISDELIPEVNCDDSSYIDEEDTEPTVKVAYFPDESTAAGAPIGYSEYPSMQYMELKARYPLTSENSDNFFIIKVEGNSMNKLVEDGTKILVRANRFIENGTIALVNIVDKEGTTLKYYYYDPITRSVTLSPYSTDPSYTDMVFSDKDRVLIHGEYIGPISDFL